MKVISKTVVSARNPGTWGDGIRVGIIDSKADQIFTSDGSGINLGVGMGVSQDSHQQFIDEGRLSRDGSFKGIVTNKDGDNNQIQLKFLNM